MRNGVPPPQVHTRPASPGVLGGSWGEATSLEMPKEAPTPPSQLDVPRTETEGLRKRLVEDARRYGVTDKDVGSL